MLFTTRLLLYALVTVLTVLSWIFCIVNRPVAAENSPVPSPNATFHRFTAMEKRQEPVITPHGSFPGMTDVPVTIIQSFASEFSKNDLTATVNTVTSDASVLSSVLDSGYFSVTQTLSALDSLSVVTETPSTIDSGVATGSTLASDTLTSSLGPGSTTATTINTLSATSAPASTSLVTSLSTITSAVSHSVPTSTTSPHSSIPAPSSTHTVGSASHKVLVGEGYMIGLISLALFLGTMF